MQATYSIDYELTGSELLALLRESTLILKYFPKFNKAQKKVNRPYTLTSYHNQKGIEQFVIHKNKVSPVSWMKFYTREEAINFLEFICTEFKLCPRYCGLQTGVEHCSHYKIKSCSGMCKGEIDATGYNQRVARAIEYIQEYENSCLLMEKGRSKEEKSFIYLKKGRYAGYGYVENTEDFRPQQFEDYLIPQENSSYSDRIINRYLNTKKQLNRLNLDREEEVEELETEVCFGAMAS